MQAISMRKALASVATGAFADQAAMPGQDRWLAWSSSWGVMVR